MTAGCALRIGEITGPPAHPRPGRAALAGARLAAAGESRDQPGRHRAGAGDQNG